jgi:DNA-binding IclR family transcriptional regulator
MPVIEPSIRRNRAEWRDLSTSLDRALAIFDLVSEKRGGITNAELARRLSIPTSSCSYVLQRLERAGYLTRSEETRRYELGIKVLGLAHGVLRDTGLPGVADPILTEIAQKTGQVVIVAILHKNRITILRRTGLPELVDVDFEMGASFPAHATAIGKMLLARLPDVELHELLDSQQLVKRSPRTINSKADLIRNLEDIRRRGHSTSNGELFTRIRGLAVAIVDDAGQTCAGLTVAGPRLRLDDDEAIRAIHDGAALISKRFQETAARQRSLNSPVDVLTALHYSGADRLFRVSS